MLILTRSENESFVCETENGAIEVRVLNINGGSCRIGIDAPKSVRILRDDAVDRKPKYDLPRV